MFESCDGLTSFDGSFAYLNSAISMFGGCENITYFYGFLGSVTLGDKMFWECSNLQYVSDYHSLKKFGWDVLAN